MISRVAFLVETLTRTQSGKVFLVAGGLLALKGFIVRAEPLQLDDLTWKFAPGDDLSWAAPGLDIDSWQEVRLPHRWAPYSMDGTGHGWYRVELPPGLRDNSGEVLNLGVVGYVCEVFLDGERIYTSGDMQARMWQPLYLPDVIELPLSENEGRPRDLAVRVRASWGMGGMLKGPWTLHDSAGEADQTFFKAFQNRWTVSLAIVCSIVIWIVVLSLLLFLKRRPPGLRSVLVFLLCLVFYYPLIAMRLPEAAGGYDESSMRIVNDVIVLLTAVMIYVSTVSLHALLNQALPKWLNRVLILLLLVAVFCQLHWFGRRLKRISSALLSGSQAWALLWSQVARLSGKLLEPANLSAGAWALR